MYCSPFARERSATPSFRLGIDSPDCLPSMPAVLAKQYLNVMEHMWAMVDQHFDPVAVLTQDGRKLVQTYCIKASHPELPYTLHFLSMMCSMANGAKSQWFPNSPSPLFLDVS